MLKLVNGESFEIFIEILREDSAISLKDSYLELDFIVSHRAGAHARYADGDHIGLVNIGPLALFNEYRLTNSSGKEVEEIDNDHVFYLMHKLISSSRDSDDLSIGFQRSIDDPDRELTNNKTTKVNYHVRTFLKDVFGCAEHQDKCTYGLGYKLTLQRNNDNHVLSHRAGATNAENLVSAGRVFLEDISLFVPHYTPNISRQKLMLGHTVTKAATELSYVKRSSYLKDVTTGNTWVFDLGVGDVSIYLFM